MAVLKPFKAHRPKPEFIQEIACVPYDVINTEEAKVLAEGKPLSFLHVIRPEIDVDPSISIYDNEVYQTGKRNLDRMLASEKMLQEDSDSLYIYQLIMNGRTQTGIFGCVSVEDYDNEVILKHELTRPDKEDDRTKHILTQEAHAEPVMMTFRDTKGIADFIQSYTSGNDPIYSFTASDDVTHTIWRVSDTSDLVSKFDGISKLYIADGHHRCKSASRVAEEIKKENASHTGTEEYNYFPAVLFPMDDMEIMAYNRVVYNIPDTFLDELGKVGQLTETNNPVPENKGDVCIYVNGTWYTMTLPTHSETDPVSVMDVSRISAYILEPLLNIVDLRRDSNIHFVGGIRGTEELERLVDSGKAQLAISVYPIDIQELIDVSDAGMLMPPKVTWFEPKLRSGLLIHTF